MTASAKFTRWCIEPKDLENLSAEGARDLIIRCFTEAQHETFERSRVNMGLPAGEQDIAKSVLASIKAVFREVGGNFQRPTKAELMRVVEALAGRAAGWGTPRDIIDYHGKQIAKIFEKLE